MMITGATIPAKEIDGKLWIPADHYQPALQAAYIGGVLAEREACAKLCEEITSWHDKYDNLVTAAYVSACADAIRARREQ